VRLVRTSSLSLFFLALFALCVVLQAVAGLADFNHQQALHRDDPVALGTFLASSAFWVDVMENWQSEYLQFTLYVVACVWLVQEGSTESKPLGEEGRETDEEQLVREHARPGSPAWAKAGGWRLRVYENSLLLVMGSIWVATWVASAVTGRVEFNATQLDHQAAPVSLGRYVLSGDFWNRTLQNWQSEFLAIGSMAVLSISLRQRGSSQSKKVGAPHSATGDEG
jgi:Ca2+/Na+ antiporter